nr:MAG TPA: hypothetical protein [Caudoviricetes sp.]
MVVGRGESQERTVSHESDYHDRDGRVERPSVGGAASLGSGDAQSPTSNGGAEADCVGAVSRAGGIAGEGGEVSSLNVARVLVALALVVLAWVLGAAIDAWVPAAAAIVVPVLLAERLVYVVWKEARA